MRTQLKINGELKDVEIQNGEVTIIEPEKKQTGWERAKKGTGYTCISLGVRLYPETDSYFATDDILFRAANYFTNDKLAESINRMQTIQRQLFRWQAENDVPINLNRKTISKWFFYFNINSKQIETDYTNYIKNYNVPYFSSKAKVIECIKVFKDELTWLFTEFKWRMDGD